MFFDENVTAETDHCFIMLVIAYGFDMNDSPVGFRLRFSFIEDDGFCVQCIVDKYRSEMFDIFISQIGNRFTADIGNSHADNK